MTLDEKERVQPAVVALALPQLGCCSSRDAGQHRLSYCTQYKDVAVWKDKVWTSSITTCLS
jgi:hypothetical protein